MDTLLLIVVVIGVFFGLFGVFVGLVGEYLNTKLQKKKVRETNLKQAE